MSAGHFGGMLPDFTTLTNQLNAITQAVNNLNNSLNILLPAGAYHPISATDASQSTNSVYFSTTNSLLSYKDSSGVVNPLYYTTLNATATYNPPSIADKSSALSSGITVTGAVFGNYVEVSAPYDLQGLSATAYVSASDTVVILLLNNTGGAVDLASGTWKIRVTK